MSVQLAVLKDDEFLDIELMASDLDIHYVWLWDAEIGDNRINLSRKQMQELRDALDNALSQN